MKGLFDPQSHNLRHGSGYTTSRVIGWSAYPRCIRCGCCATSLSNNPTTTENVVLPAYLYDLSTRPQLTISRAPAFIPITDDSPYHHTDQLAHNRLGFRYMPAGLANEGSTTPFRTIESAPQSYCVSWEDRSPFVKVCVVSLASQSS